MRAIGLGWWGHHLKQQRNVITELSEGEWMDVRAVLKGMAGTKIKSSTYREKTQHLRREEKFDKKGGKKQRGDEKRAPSTMKRKRKDVGIFGFGVGDS